MEDKNFMVETDEIIEETTSKENPGVTIEIGSSEELTEVFIDFLKNRTLTLELSGKVLSEIIKGVADKILDDSDYVNVKTEGTTVEGGNFKVVIRCF